MEAAFNLASDLSSLKVSVSKDKKTGAIVVDGIGYDDFLILARASLYRVDLEGITNKTIISLLSKAINNKQKCRFAGSPGKIQCGPALVDLDSQSLMIDGVKFYGVFFGSEHYGAMSAQ